MREFRNTAAAAAIAVMAATTVLGGCSKSDSQETTAAETSAGETEAETLSEDAQAIADLDPQKPDDMGTVKLGDISSLTVKAPEAQVIDDETVNDMITYYLTMGGEKEEVDEPAEDGYTANIDFVGKIDGEEFDGGSAEGYDLTIGSGSFIDGFESGLVGHKAGEEVTLDLTFPDDYSNADLAGKPVEFDVKINSISRDLDYNDLNDERADQYSGGQYKTADEYRAAVREYLEKSALAESKNTLYNNCINAIVAASDTEPSEAAIGWAVDVYTQYSDQMYKSYGSMMGLSGLADYLAQTGTSYADYRENMKDDAKVLAEQTAVVDAIAKEQGFEYNDETYMDYLTDMGYEDQADAVKEANTDAALQQTVVQFLVGRYISENATVEYVPYEQYEEELAAETEAADNSAAAETADASAETESESAAQ